MRKGYSCNLLLLLLAACTGCERDIHLDYRTAEARYVVEAGISQTGTEAIVTTTQAMDDNTVRHAVTDAHVVITSGDSIRQPLTHQGKGRYTAPLCGSPGTTYRLTVEAGGQTFTSTSTMPEATRILSFRFVWKEVLARRYLFGDLCLQDPPGRSNYYFMHLYRGGIGYRWAVMTDRAAPGGELQQLFTCQRENTDDSGALREGDRLHLVVRTIDQRAYDYLYSMQVMDEAGSNPIDNFTGGCLGYFSAYNELTLDTVFHFSQVGEE